ncbi:MAG: hypothetical protein M0R80_02755 [Proteobacteria bacterium]|jgi:hypothetical protein|nr:hypothetical protein [Pseudomonadota bacterium]
MNFKEKYPEFFPATGYVEIAIAEGWNDLVDRLFTAIRANKVDLKVLQIKEKFGGLRFYYSIDTGGGDVHSVLNLIEQAERDSYHICEVCGEQGCRHTNKNGWVKTLCDKHAQEKGYLKEK